MVDHVVRGGTATADLLQRGYGQHRGVARVYGLSVQYAPGQGKTLRDLANAGQLRNTQISYATPEELLICVQPLGYAIQLIKTPGLGHHHTFCVVYDVNKVMLQKLPRDAAARCCGGY